MTFKEAWQICNVVPGWFSLEDAMALYSLLKEADGNILEIGSFLGKSAIFISCFKPVVCIDPWLEGPKMKQCLQSKIPSNLHHFTFYELFLFFTKNYNILHLKDYDFNVWNNWDKQISLIYLDHSHTEKAVFESLVNWKKFLKPNSKIMIHDSNINGVLKGIEKSGVFVEKIIIESKYKPAICKWIKCY